MKAWLFELIVVNNGFILYLFHIFKLGILTENKYGLASTSLLLGIYKAETTFSLGWRYSNVKDEIKENIKTSKNTKASA